MPAIVFLYLAIYFNSVACTMMLPLVLVHGGAGDIVNARVPLKLAGCKAAAKAGYKVLQEGGSAVEAVEAAIKVMEDDPAFNAGYGSVLNIEGEVEMDSSIMQGSDLNAGAVSIVKDVAHPISLAKLVMEKTPHVLLAAHGAVKFAIEQGVPILSPGSLATKESVEGLSYYKKHGGVIMETGSGEDSCGGTVGAVAIDSNGHVAAGTSTGGLNGKMVGRSGDSCQIGSGTYADDNGGAVSATGHGESIIKVCLGHSIVKLMEQGISAQKAAENCVSNMTAKLNNSAGVITISKKGDVGIAFSSSRMAWAYQCGKKIHFGADAGQHDIEKV